MPFEETVTIINNSGKIISTGRQLLNLFKEAKANYEDRKAAIREIRRAESSPSSPTSPTPGIRRAATYAGSGSGAGNPKAVYEEAESEEDDFVPELQKRISFYQDEFDPTPNSAARMYLQDDNRSFISRKSHRSHRSSRSSRTGGKSRVSSSSSRRGGSSIVSSSTGSALTASNLRALTEISSSASGAVPNGYRHPYAETAPRDMQLSRVVLSQAAPSTASGSTVRAAPTTVVTRGKSFEVAQRPKSSASDDALAYGESFDLAERHDLVEYEEPVSPEMDEAVMAKAIEDEKEAKNLIRIVEKLLDEAHCVHHTASSIIEHLQGNPEAAAAVALTLAELSSILGKLSPGILGLIKGGSPAVFALLASPQFLIGVTAVVGVTVVMFGGWKIIKGLQGETPVKKPMAMAAQKPALQRSVTVPARESSLVGAPEQAVLVDDVSEISSIERWRRGVPTLIDEDSADEEIMTPHARKHRHRSTSGSWKYLEEVTPDDSVTSVGNNNNNNHRSSHHKSSASWVSGSGKFLDEVTPDDSVTSIGNNHRSSHRSTTGSSVSKHSLASSRASGSSRNRTRDRDGATSSILWNKNVSVASSSSSRSSKVSSVSRPSTIKTKGSSSKAGSVASSATSAALSSAGSSSSSSSSRKKKEDGKLDDARSKVAEKAHKGSSGKSVLGASSSSSASKKEKEGEEKKKPNLLKSMFQRKKASEQAVMAA